MMTEDLLYSRLTAVLLEHTKLRGNTIGVVGNQLVKAVRAYIATSEPSPSTGGEPATDSAGRERWSHTKCNGIGCAACDWVGTAPVWPPAAAREPAPVARELDVEAERRGGVMRALKDACDIAMRNTLAARVPECGDFGAIAQDLSWAIDQLEAQATAESAPASAAPDEQQERDARWYRLLRDTPKVPGQVWAALESGEGIDEAMELFEAITTPIPFCEQCKAGRYAECQYAIPCTLPAAPSNTSPVGAKEPK